MKSILTILLCVLLNNHLQAQFIESEEGQYDGSNISQADLDILFANDPNLTWLNFDYKDSTLILPNFQKLDILAIQSEVLKSLVFPDTLLGLGLIDFELPQLRSINEPVLPNLFQMSCSASLAKFPAFFCASPSLTLVNIKNYQNINWPDCLEARFIDGPFEISTCEILDGIDGPIVSKIMSPDNASDEWLESSDDMSDEELKDLEKGMQRTGRMIAVVRRATSLALAGIVFLIFKS
jgi:hypothetical protein